MQVSPRKKENLKSVLENFSKTVSGGALIRDLGVSIYPLDFFGKGKPFYQVGVWEFRSFFERGSGDFVSWIRNHGQVGNSCAYTKSVFCL